MFSLLREVSAIIIAVYPHSHSRAFSVARKLFLALRNLNTSDSLQLVEIPVLTPMPDDDTVALPCYPFVTSQRPLMTSGNYCISGMLVPTPGIPIWPGHTCRRINDILPAVPHRNAPLPENLTSTHWVVLG